MKRHAYGFGHLDMKLTPRSAAKGLTTIRSSMVQQWRQLAEAAVDPTCLYSSTASTALMKAIGKLAAFQCTKNVSAGVIVCIIMG